jgi:uncharacterized caspase-like protein
MIDAITERPLVVKNTGGGPVLFDVPASQLKEIQALLDGHGIRYSVEEYFIAFDGKPETTAIYFGHAVDSKKIQSVLDSAG